MLTNDYMAKKKRKRVVFREYTSLRIRMPHTKVVKNQKNMYNLIKFNQFYLFTMKLYQNLFQII